MNKNVKKKKQFISLCMIVKDEENCLGRCLDSVREHVDEIIIVDTGSTDRTVSIAERFGARIHHHPWENDFSKHRNQSLSYATGDWIFQLDADEELCGEDGPRLREIVLTGKADYYHCQFHDLRKDGSVHGVFSLVRLFRNGMGMDYERKVHNQLRTCGREAYSPIRIRHYGYDLSREQMEAKHLRTTSLLKEMLANDPEDAYSLYQISSSCSMHRDFDEAVAYGERALEIMRQNQLKQSYFMTVYHTVAHGYAALGRMEEAERVCLEAIEVFPMHLDMCHMLADLYFRKRDARRHKSLAQRYLGIHHAMEKDPSLMGGSYSHTFARREEIFFGLACVHFVERDFEQADTYFLKSFEDSGRKLEKAEHICRFYLEQAMDDEALRWLTLASEAELGQLGVSSSRLGRMAYDATEAFCRHRKWNLAEQALKLAVRIDPSQFNSEQLSQLLPTIA